MSAAVTARQLDAPYWATKHETDRERAGAAHDAWLADTGPCSICQVVVDKSEVFVAGPNGPLHFDCAPDPNALRRGQLALL